MDPTPEKRFSFPNSDQVIPGVSGNNTPQPERLAPRPKPTVNILDALETQKREEADTEKIHTFQGDIASAIKNDNLSMIKVALAEKKRQERQGSQVQLEEEKSPKKAIMILAIVIVAIVIIAGIVLFVLNAVSSNGAVPAGQIVAAPLLYTEERAYINVDQKDSDDVTRLIRREIDKPLDLGSMRAIDLILGTGTSTKEVSLSEFLGGLKARASDTLIRSLDPRFLLGIYSFSPKDFFLLIKVNSYDNAFASMLQWEPDMENDIGNIFITRKAIVPLNGTTTAAGPLFSGRVWVDRVVNNKDARLLIDTDGNPAMLYTFLDKETLVIASSDKALKEIMFRLTAGRIVR